jgi:toxin ParE1/3/4
VARYSLTNQADADFQAIFEYGIDQFGLVQAETYQREMIVRFREIARNPLHYPSLPEDIREGYRRSVFNAHSIYFRIVDEQSILIVRILGRQDISSVSFE